MERPILIVRADPEKPRFYDVILRWLQKEHPSLFGLIQVQELPVCLPPDSAYKLCVLWVQDPADLEHPAVYSQACCLCDLCRDLGIPMVNDVRRHTNLSRLEFHRRLADAGIRSPKTVLADSPARVQEVLLEWGGQALLGENRGHQRPLTFIEAATDPKAPGLESFREPVLREFVDVRSEDGLYRKYRSVLAGEHVVSHHLQISESWLTRGDQRLDTPGTREEEIEFLIAPDPRGALLQRAREALDIDFVAFDYGIDRRGQAVLWEGNQYPHLHFSKFNLYYRNFAMDRTLAALVRYYLERAGIEPPPKLVRQSAYE